MLKRCWIAGVLLLGAGSEVGGIAAALADQKTPVETTADPLPARTREFHFTYSATIKQLPAGTNVRVWIPIPASNEHQSIATVNVRLPAKPVTGTELNYGNQVLYFKTKAPQSGELNCSATYRVKRYEVLGLKSKTGTELADAQRNLYLAANAKVPIDGKPVALLKGLKLPKRNPLKLGELLYNKVEDHMKYDKSKPGYGTGDAVWACDSRFGNCTDFHSLFISMTRSQGVPARFEIGFSLPEKRGAGDIGGYHCWAFFHVAGHGWVPVDISEADKHPARKKYYFGNLTENRVMFTVGRDLTLVPKQDGDRLNFFVYPHVEVDGKVWSKEKLKLHFRFKDM